jgi:hypothetical protein
MDTRTLTTQLLDLRYIYYYGMDAVERDIIIGKPLTISQDICYGI